MSGNRLYSRTLGHFEKGAVIINAFIALDGSSNVVGYAPTTPGSAVATTAYSLPKGLSNALGPAGGVLNQPHTATGTYIFTLDEPWVCLLNADVMFLDQGAVNALNFFVDANVSNQSANIGSLPGNNPALTPNTVRVRFRGGTGTLTDPVANTGFWLQLWLKDVSTP